MNSYLFPKAVEMKNKSGNDRQVVHNLIIILKFTQTRKVNENVCIYVVKARLFIYLIKIIIRRWD